MMNKKVFFEKFTANDFNLYFKLVSNYEVMKMITEKGLTQEEALKDFNKIIEANSLHPILGTYKVFNLANDFVGLAKLEIKDIKDTEAELGYMLLPNYWGMGLGSIIAEDLVELAKKQKKLIKLTAIIDPINIPSRKILIKNNFNSKEFKDFDGLPGEILELELKK
ncbi:GNAT family N-acetyltransferase [Acinetobacter sp. 1207_04]|uniref:GNAT family N-acetyltransferase n=1 Tax=Acinetobacter sp. 1207_04 TaxID=2604449 RepID=UPI004058CF41